MRNTNMRLFKAQVDEPELQDLIREISNSTTDQIRAVLEFARTDVLVFLKSYTNVYRPPRYERKFRLDAASRRVAVVPGEGMRPAHPGGWADVEFDLRDNYYSQLNWVNGGWQLLVGNRSEHAIFVEAMDGYFVVSGIMEARGPVMRSIRNAIKALGLKDWEVKTGLGPLNEPASLVSPKSGKSVPAPDLSPWR